MRLPFRAALSCLLLAAGLALAAQPAERARSVVLVEVEGAIGPAVKDHVVRALKTAAERRAEALVIRIDTPGGLDTSMRDIIKAILASPVPVVAYVAPGGARAASAGTYILYASHVAAMAPATNLGAATPVPVGGEPPTRPEPSPGAGGPERPAAPGSASDRKAVNDAVAYIRGLAELRGRNVEWAEQAVLGAASLPADEALAQGVVDVVAPDLPSLLEALDGREVRLTDGPRRLATAGVVVERIETDWRTELLAILTNPTIAYGLLLIGLYGLLLEGYNPGAVVPGVVGAIALLLALFAFQLLPVNYAGLALIALGVVMIVAELFLPSFGSLGVGGIVAFVIGSVMLMDTDVPGFAVSRALIASIAASAGALMLGTLWLVARGQRRPVTTGVEELLHSEAEVVEPFVGRGLVRVRGETWNAVSPAPVEAGQRVRIVRVEGLTLHVEPASAPPR